MTITLGDRIFYGVIFLAALLVAVLGLLAPPNLASILPWAQVPPLHARFIGAMYGFGAVYMLGCMLSSRFAEVRWAHLLIAIWTGMLFLISLTHLEAFNLSRLPDQIWFASYILYPLIALGLMWRQQPWKQTLSTKPDMPVLARNLLSVQGWIVVVVAVALLLVPAFVAKLWPWPVAPLLAQVYAGPLLAYGLAGVLYARQGVLMGLPAVIWGMLTFTLCTLAASVVHRKLFSATDFSDWLWFVFFVGFSLELIWLLRSLLARANHPYPNAG